MLMAYSQLQACVHCPKHVIPNITVITMKTAQCKAWSTKSISAWLLAEELKQAPVFDTSISAFTSFVSVHIEYCTCTVCKVRRKQHENIVSPTLLKDERRKFCFRLSFSEKFDIIVEILYSLIERTTMNSLSLLPVR